MKKIIKRTVDFLIQGGSATTGFPIGATLSLVGVDAVAFASRFNEVTKGWNEFIFNVKIIVYINGEFDLVIKSPKVWDLFIYIAKESNEKLEVTKTNIYNICKFKLLNKPYLIKSFYKSILSLLKQNKVIIKNE